MEDHRYGRYAPIPTATLRSAQSAMELAGLRVAHHDLWQGVRNRCLTRQKLNCLNTLIGILLHKLGDYFRQVFMGLRPTEWWLVTGTSKMGLLKVCDFSPFAKTGHYCINSIMIIYQDGCWTIHRDMLICHETLGLHQLSWSLTIVYPLVGDAHPFLSEGYSDQWKGCQCGPALPLGSSDMQQTGI